MKITHFLIVTVLCLGMFNLTTVQAQDTAKADTSVSLKKVLRVNRYPIGYDTEGLTGKGGQWLRRQAKEATIVTLGETHLSQEIPALMTALIKDLQQADEFDHLAIEVSPWTTELMTKQLQQGNGAYNELIKQHPFAVPFYNFQTERKLLQQAVKGSDAEQPLWGLDQIFAFSLDLALDRLKALAPSKQAQRAIHKIRKAGRSKSADHLQLQKLAEAVPTPISVYQPVTFDTLRSHFEGNREAQQILAELSKSVEIYRLNDTNNYVSNQIRARYMRDNLRNSLQYAQRTADENPQVVVKVGARHAYRGMTPNNTLDVDNLSVALARAMDGEALNVAVLCGANSKMSAFPTREAQCTAGNFGKTFKSLAKKRSVVFDLSKVHLMLHEGALHPDRDLEKFLWAFDAVVIIPNTTPAEPIFTSGK